MPAKQETHCLVVYDIEENGRRTKISNACLDTGLERIQYSVFWGKLTTAKRKELFRRIQDILEDATASVVIIPVTEQNFEKRLQIEQEKPPEKNDAHSESGKDGQCADQDKKKKPEPYMKKMGEKRQTIMRFEID